jgi:hypothetical protein
LRARRAGDNVGQEVDEGIARVARHGLALNFAGLFVQGGNNDSVPCR